MIDTWLGHFLLPEYHDLSRLMLQRGNDVFEVYNRLEFLGCLFPNDVCHRLSFGTIVPTREARQTVSYGLYELIHYGVR